MCIFAYLYVRPLIRRRLGSASKGYINWSTIYIVWLLAAVFYHLPSLESLGLDVKADVSMLLTVFLLTLVVLGALTSIHGTLVALRYLPPKLIDLAPSTKEMFTLIVLNATAIAIACSSYYSFCGNAVVAAPYHYSQQQISMTKHHVPSSSRASTLFQGQQRDGIRDLVCTTWLHPVSATRHPAFSAWVLYGESTNVSQSIEASTGVVDGTTGNGILSSSKSNDKSTNTAGSSISPVFTTWLTLFCMILANTLGDYAAFLVTSAAYSSQKRKAMQRYFSRRTSSRHQGSAEYPQSASSYASFGSYTSLFAGSQDGSRTGSQAHGLDLLMRTVSNVGNLWNQSSPSLDNLMGLKNASAIFFRDDFNIGLSAAQPFLQKLNSSLRGEDKSSARPSMELPAAALSDPDLVAGIGLPVPDDAPAPAFLPMFPWYSGTSADLLKTLFDLLVSVKVFLGRFDMRTMQAASGTGGGGGAAGGGGVVPRDGDGFTYEHLAGKEEAWIDFCADTGDGGDPTYSVARCMAAQHVTVEVPEGLTSAAGVAGHSGVKRLPRADVLVHGGDLAYPNPTDETYEQRLWSPYEAAFPPPAHVHPGQLVVNKPDLPPEYWEAAAATTTTKATDTFAAINTNNNTGEVLVDSYKVKHRTQRPSACSCINNIGATHGTHRTMCSACHKASTLAAYDGPSAFFIPGNHDWIDGLETFQKHIVHKGWIGGWLLPQEKSYFALHLPHGWWLFAVDLALDDDIDMCQYRYFAKVAEERMQHDHRAIIVTHCPQWLIDWFWGRNDGKNLRQLLRGPLRGRARIHLAGDLHFYMRHSFKKYTRDPTALNGISPPRSEMSTPAGGSPVHGGSPLSSRCPTPTPSFGGGQYPQSNGLLHQSLVKRLKSVAMGSNGSNAAPAAGLSTRLNGGISNAGHGVAAGTGAAALGDTGVSNSADPLLNDHMKKEDSDDAYSAVETDMMIDPGTIPDQEMLLGIDGRSIATTTTTTMPVLAGSSPPSLAQQRSLPAPVSTPPPPPPQPARPTTRALSPLSASSTTTATQPSLQHPPPIPHEQYLSSLESEKTSYSLGSSPPVRSSTRMGSSPKSQFPWWNTFPALRTPRNGSTSTAGGSPIADMPAYDSMGYRRNGPAFSENEWDGPPPGWQLNAPEHLVVCGAGGAFLHPTHIFSYARFRPVHDAAAGPVYIPPIQGSSLESQHSGGGPASLLQRQQYTSNNRGLRRGFPSSSSLYSLPRNENNPPPGGEYRCMASAPTEKESRNLGKANLHTFRHVNNRFDIIGGALYYLLVVSVLPRCTGVAGILDAHSLGEVVTIFAGAFVETVGEIFSKSYISLIALIFLFVVVFGFAKGGGVGAIHGIPPSARRKPEYKGFALAVRARAGGASAQLTYAVAHAATHLSAAIALLLLLELGVETVIRYEGVGQDGYHSLYKWYQNFEAQHFPDPAGLRGTVSKWTLSLYPNLIKWVFAVFDVPEAIAVSRNAICAAGGSLASLSRLQVLGYYGGVLLYFWVLATPIMGFLFGLYLYISGNWLHLHYDESFSSLQVAGHKGFLRLHVTKEGDLEVYSLNLKEVPHSWREDPRWKAPGGGGFSSDVPAHRVKWPSRWAPVTETMSTSRSDSGGRSGGAGLSKTPGDGGSGGYGSGQYSSQSLSYQQSGSGSHSKKVLHTSVPPEATLKVVDYFVVPKDAIL